MMYQPGGSSVASNVFVTPNIVGRPLPPQTSSHPYAPDLRYPPQPPPAYPLFPSQGYPAPTLSLGPITTSQVAPPIPIPASKDGAYPQQQVTATSIGLSHQTMNGQPTSMFGMQLEQGTGEWPQSSKF